MTPVQFIKSLTPEQLAAYQLALSAANPGSVKSPAKSAAARQNGRKGGRPRKSV